MNRFDQSVVLGIIISFIPLQPAISGERDLPELSFEDLMQVEVSSPARKVQSLAETAAAVYVITGEMIRRSGATSIPEALRLAPGVEVAQISSSEWAVTIRGFNGHFANKLLVQVDGRTVYTPSYSGVYWETLDLPLDDIERIEVIRGPGATLWGANAVNGIINIISRDARDTEGALVRTTAGTGILEATGRYGGALTEALHGRLYARHRYRDGLWGLDGRHLEDDWEQQQAGFRVDWTGAAAEELTLTGDLFRLDKGQEASLPDTTAPDLTRNERSRLVHSGANLLGRWQKYLDPASEVQLQFYLDYYDRDESQHHEKRRTFDLDFQHRFALGQRHDMVWGLGLRHTEDDTWFDPDLWVVTPGSRTDRIFSGFVQDEIEFIEDRLWLTLGTKLEYNDYSGFELQPNVRALLQASTRQYFWASVSRAARTPSRGERDARFIMNALPADHPLNPFPLPAISSFVGSRDLESETLWAYELGYRLMPRDDFNLDLALYYHDYDRLRSAESVEQDLVDGFIQVPLVVDNELHGSGYGFELAVEWRPLNWWRLQASYSYSRLELEPESTNLYRINDSFIEGVSPRQQLSLLSSFDPARNWELDLWLRYVDELSWTGSFEGGEPLAVDAYYDLDLRLGWRPSPQLELALIGRNLLEPRRLEFVEEIYPIPAEIERSVFVTVSFGF